MKYEMRIVNEQLMMDERISDVDFCIVHRFGQESFSNRSQISIVSILFFKQNLFSPYHSHSAKS